MLPDIECKQRNHVRTDWRISIGRAHDPQFARVEYQPCPAAAELRQRHGTKFLLEFVDIAKFVFDQFANSADGRRLAGRRQALPEESVIPGLSRIVQNFNIRLFTR